MMMMMMTTTTTTTMRMNASFNSLKAGFNKKSCNSKQAAIKSRGKRVLSRRKVGDNDDDDDDVCLSVSPSTCLSICRSLNLFVCQYVCQSVYLSVCLLVRLPICMSICTCKYVVRLSVRLPVSLSVNPSICLSVWQPIYLSFCLSTCLSVCQSFYLSVNPSVYLSLCSSFCLSEAEDSLVLKCIFSSQHCELDPIPASILTDCSSVLFHMERSFTWSWPPPVRLHTPDSKFPSPSGWTLLEARDIFAATTCSCSNRGWRKIVEGKERGREEYRGRWN